MKYCYCLRLYCIDVNLLATTSQLCVSRELRLHQSYDVLCQVVKKMLVGERHYVIMVATLATTDNVTETFFL